MNSPELLSVKDLKTYFFTEKKSPPVKAVDGISLEVKAGSITTIVGESGSGKSITSLSILGLVSNPGKIVSGEIIFNGKAIHKLNDAQMRKIRGDKISMIFQDPMTALNPVDTVGEQIEEVLKLHQPGAGKEEIRQKAVQMLETVGIPGERIDEYPHQFSGGMKQRIVIAIALACSPELLIADEPTTALDVTIQAQILELMNKLKGEMNTSMLLITHDLGVVAEMCSRVAIIYAGEVVEIGTARDIFKNRSHPYTQGLFNSLPSVTGEKTKLKPIPGAMPDPSNLPAGCPFAPRCGYACEKCMAEHPELLPVEGEHYVRCWRAAEEEQHGIAAG